jgi:hypothetical protein
MNAMIARRCTTVAKPSPSQRRCESSQKLVFEGASSASADALKAARKKGNASRAR